ncbi:MAG: hypothetical protein ACK55Z_27710, partial [bacterium]
IRTPVIRPQKLIFRCAGTSDSGTNRRRSYELPSQPALQTVPQTVLQPETQSSVKNVKPLPTGYQEDGFHHHHGRERIAAPPRGGTSPDRTGSFR